MRKSEMSEARPIASLSSTLLARKGHAKPAMRPQGYTNFGFGASHPVDDLGWNDMGGEATESPPEPRVADVVPITSGAAPVAAFVAGPVEPPVVHRQQEEIAREMASPVPQIAAQVVEQSAEVIAEATADEPVTDAPVEPAAAPAAANVERRRDARSRGAVAVELDRVVVARSARGSKAKAAFTLRLDPDRHLKLRLAGALAHRSSQAIVVDALDAFLATLPRVGELAIQAAAARSIDDQNSKSEDKR